MKWVLVIGVVWCVWVAAAGEQYVYVGGGEIKCAPRELPSVGVRLDTGAVVLGLHGASDGVRAACGWYRVKRSTTELAVNEVVTGRSYVVNRNTVQEVVTVGERQTRTIDDRIEAVFAAPELQRMGEDERVSAVIAAVAAAVTGKVDRVMTVTTPSRSVAK